MDYMKGTISNKIDSNERIIDILNATRELEKQIYLLAKYEGIVLDDVVYDSLIYTDDKRFKMTDTDGFLFEPSEELKYNFQRSIIEISNNILDLFAYNYPFKDDKLNDDFINCICDGKIKPSVILLKILEKIEKETQDKIITLSDYKEGQKLLKKSL